MRPTNLKEPTTMMRTTEAAPRRARPTRRVNGVILAGLAVSVVLAGCSLDGLLNNDKLPVDVQDPAITETPEGAFAAYRGALAQFRDVFAGGGTDSRAFIPVTGM